MQHLQQAQISDSLRSIRNRSLQAEHRWQLRYSDTVAPAQVSPANCGSTSAYLSPADYQNNNSGISYGVGCNSCSSNADAPVASDQPIDANQLNDMINALVKAMKGE